MRSRPSRRALQPQPATKWRPIAHGRDRDGQFAVGQDPTAREPQSVAIIENRAYVTNYRSDTISVFEFGEQCAEKKS
jgi:hypothetical protein